MQQYQLQLQQFAAQHPYAQQAQLPGRAGSTGTVASTSTAGQGNCCRPSQIQNASSLLTDNE